MDYMSIYTSPTARGSSLEYYGSKKSCTAMPYHRRIKYTSGRLRPSDKRIKSPSIPNITFDYSLVSKYFFGVNYNG